MKNTAIFIIFITLLIFVGGLFINQVQKDKSPNSSPQTQVAPEAYEYYWSETCPHCTNVAKFLDGWKKALPAQAGKIQMEKLEVNESADNTNRFIARGIFCNIPKNQLGVPLLVTPSGKCYNGNVPIIDYFNSLEL